MATIVIKRLEDALVAGDPVRAVIRESHVNQDGRTESITSPSQAAQVKLMRDCYRKAGLNPGDTQYFEVKNEGCSYFETCKADIFLVYRHMERAPLPGTLLKQEPSLQSLHLQDVLIKPCA